MSLFSRLFRKAPPSRAASDLPTTAPVASSTQPDAPSGAPDRKLLAAKEEQDLEAAIGSGDYETVGKFVIEGTSTKIRQTAAQAIEDPVQLRQLIRDVRGGSDKSVYKILTHKRDVLLEQARQQEQLQTEMSAVSAALERHSRRGYDALYAPTLEQLENRWKTIASEAGPPLAAQVQEAIDRSRDVIAQHRRELEEQAARELSAANAASEAQHAREVAARAAAEAAAERAGIEAAERKAQAEKREAEALALRQIGGLIRQALGALREGSTGRTAGIRRALEEKLATAPPLPTYLSNQLRQLDEQLEALKDWKSFSVTPKRAELIAEMESLVGATLEPPVLAERIRDLQEQWRTLNRGAGESVEAEWQRFRDAAQSAYQPCREYFEAQASLRQENLQRRAALLQRLAALESQHDWNQPDWPLIVRALRESKQEWRRHWRVDRRAGKALQETFDTVTASLQNRLDAEYAYNVKEKRRLIESARQLSEIQESRQAIEEVKELQRKWKGIGLTPREQSEQLWSEFREQCDAVFERRRQQSADYSASLEANKTAAIALCETVEGLGSVAGAELLAAAARLPQLRTDFEALGELPKANAHELHRRFERAVERCETAAAEQKARDAERSWMELLDAADRVRAYRLSVASNADAAQRDDLRRAAEEAISSGSRWPKGALDALKKELDRADAGDVAANETALRRLCIRAEIALELPTPAEDQALRREYQVQRLIQTMGQGVGNDRSGGGDEPLNALTLEWIGVGPTDAAVYSSLTERFRECRRKRFGRGHPG
ncbi:MAG TPA: DUF349 domain-containing protein [Steroidobacteraceae bacterium]|nr:DUF349 domain-containing protein [Steroidobacteraceae bacterium]